MGGAVRRFRQRRTGHHRSIPCCGAGKVGTNHPPSAALAPRSRGAGSRAFQRPSRAVSSTRCRRQHPRRQLLDPGPVFSPASPAGAAPGNPPPRVDDSQELAQTSPGDGNPQGAVRGGVQPRPRRSHPGCPPRRNSASRAVFRQGLLRHRGPPAAPRSAARGGWTNRDALSLSSRTAHRPHTRLSPVGGSRLGSRGTK